MKRMTRVLSGLLLVVAMCAPAWAATSGEEPLQKDDLFQGTDQFAARAKSVTEVNLDKRLIAMIGRFAMSGVDDKQIDLAKKMDFVYVRSYEYDKPGQYKSADLDAFRVRLDGPEWSHVVKERTKDEQNDVWIRTDDAGQFSELVVISAEASELNFVHLKGHMSIEELTQAGAKYGVPPAADTKPKAGAK